MIKAFLSHSSKDKNSYVRNVANWLNKDNIVYDEYTFEEGEKNLDQILKGLNETSLFVIFLSEHSLNSQWVKKEISEAKERLESNQIKKIFPIIIDENITYSDERIPDWLRQEYNLRPIKIAKIAANKIQNQLRQLAYSKNPNIYKQDRLFVGRNKKLDEFEERVHNFNKRKPISIIVSGMIGVGRRSFLHQACIKTRLIEKTCRPSVIVLDSSCSIEDLIFKLNDLKFIDINNELNNISQISTQQKINLVHKVMLTASQEKEIIYLIDDGAIVSYRRELRTWFTDIIDSYTESDRPLFAIVSRYKVQYQNRPRNDQYYFIELNELPPIERGWLLASLLDLNGIKLEKNNFDDLLNLLHGLPEQIYFAVDYIKNDTTCSLIDKFDAIKEYSNEKAATLLNKYINNSNALDFIRLLAQFELITQNFIFSIVPDKEYYSLLEQLVSESIVELIGADGNTIRLNDIVRDYIKRNQILLNNSFTDKLTEKVKRLVENKELIEEDSSIFIYTIKEALKTGLKVNNNLVIPSHYLRSIKDIYNDKGNLDKIIELSDIILQKESSLDKEIAHDIRYYLCLALAKKKDKRMMVEVQKIHGEEHSFLLGFYYRIMGRHSEAIEKFKSIINAPYIEARAKREIVQVYVYLGEFDVALNYARNNYEENRGNQFHTQAYFNCLINSENINNNEEAPKILEDLINNLRNIDSKQSKEMADTAEAYFFAKIKHNKQLALNKVEDAINAFPDNTYPILTLCDIALQFLDKEQLKRGIDLLEELQNNRKHFSPRTLNRYKAYYYALDGNQIEALNIIKEDLDNYPKESQDRIKQRISDYSSKPKK